MCVNKRDSDDSVETLDAGRVTPFADRPTLREVPRKLPHYPDTARAPPLLCPMHPGRGTWRRPWQSSALFPSDFVKSDRDRSFRILFLRIANGHGKPEARRKTDFEDNGRSSFRSTPRDRTMVKVGQWCSPFQVAQKGNGPRTDLRICARTRRGSSVGRAMV